MCLLPSRLKSVRIKSGGARKQICAGSLNTQGGCEVSEILKKNKLQMLGKMSQVILHKILNKKWSDIRIFWHVNQQLVHNNQV